MYSHAPIASSLSREIASRRPTAMSWVMPQQYQVWSQMPSAPPGWMGTWPPPAPPTGSGPPPAPAGVNPQAWGAGQWVLNPMYRGPMNGAQPMMQAWVPHPSWASQAGAAANWNPYKRVPNPGSAEYWSTKLVDNPLGLENMHIRCVRLVPGPYCAKNVDTSRCQR